MFAILHISALISLLFKELLHLHANDMLVTDNGFVVMFF